MCDEGYGQTLPYTSLPCMSHHATLPCHLELFRMLDVLAEVYA